MNILWQRFGYQGQFILWKNNQQCLIHPGNYTRCRASRKVSVVYGSFHYLFSNEPCGHQVAQSCSNTWIAPDHVLEFNARAAQRGGPTGVFFRLF